MFHAIFTDIDGTLFRSDLTIGEKTIDALRRAHESGIKVIISSGRYIPGVWQAEKQLGFPTIISAINGALIKDGDRYLASTMIPKDVYEATAGHLKGKVRSLIAFAEDEYALETDDEWFRMQEMICGAPGIRMDISSYEETSRAMMEKPYKLLAKDEDSNKLLALCSELEEMLGPSAKVILSSPNNLEVLPAGTDKGSAIKTVSAYLSIDESETIAFGDWDNDEGMLRNAGLGIAMANGSEKAKSAASFITLSNNDDGIAYALEHFGII